MDTLFLPTRWGGTFPFPHQAAFALDNPLRRRIDNPAETVDALDLTGNERVLEVGPGPGFFSVEIARRLDTGRLELFDIQPQMLEKSRRKLDHAGCANVGFHAGQAGDGLPFPDNSFDAAFLASVIGEVPDKAQCVRSLHSVLKPGGLLVFRETFSDPDRFDADELRELAEPAGFKFVDTTGSAWRDIIRFRKPS
ncbi:class I SAM-dependent methyltransferase [Mycobacterium vicinigordonae]|uniref:Methyltransferase domain-containing protein n=1 Tax=Mycobacterium vicinigordonae TaxID=1719132 RepID=A0A7D6E1T3_9MYCO|nr:class I SAM-dependent methyltransferase [Mycobacterium vicinigordonae]QLL10104.1 methyltransferase domain-containing protein [Mycobacterium vicinigordonae]